MLEYITYVIYSNIKYSKTYQIVQSAASSEISQTNSIAHITQQKVAHSTARLHLRGSTKRGLLLLPKVMVEEACMVVPMTVLAINGFYQVRQG